MHSYARKVAIIGAGHVGSHVAFALATQGEADELYIIDTLEDRAREQAHDINDAVSYLPHRVKATAARISDIGDCQILIVAAGPYPDIYKNRLDSLDATVAIMDELIPDLKALNFQGIIIVISNPCDVVAAYLRDKLDFPAERLISSGTALDSARLQNYLSDLCKVQPRSISAYVLGEHGDSSMIPWSYVRIGGESLDSLQSKLPERFPTFDRTAMKQAVRDAGFIVLQGKGSTEFGIASSTTEIVRAIFHDEQKILPVGCTLNGQYGERGIIASVPAILGSRGVEAIIEYDMTDEEKREFKESCAIIRQYMEKCGCKP